MKKPKKPDYFQEVFDKLCPQYITSLKPESVAGIKHFLRVEWNKDDSKLVKMLKQTNRFLEKNPKGIKVDFLPEMPEKRNQTRDYKEQASNLIKKHTRINIPVSQSVSCEFYDEAMRRLMNNGKPIKRISKKSVLESLDILKEYADRSVLDIPGLSGFRKEIKNSYERVKKYVKDRE